MNEHHGGTSEQNIEDQEKALYDINRLITALHISAQLGASMTIRREDIPILLEALEPVIYARAEYWRKLHESVISRKSNTTQHF